MNNINYGYPILPFPGEQFCPMVLHRDGEMCSEPTVGEKDGVKVCVYHLTGRAHYPTSCQHPYQKKVSAA